MKRLFIVSAWFLLSSGVILVGIASFQVYQLYIQAQAKEAAPSETAAAVEISSPQERRNLNGEVKGVQTILESEDGRYALVTNFLQRHDSPLKPYDYYGKVFVDLADKNNFDFRLLPAIAMQESNLCKSIPEGSFNCLGFGIHKRGTLTFESYDANFERAAKELKANYIDQGLTTPEQIMKKYTPSSNGSWADSVNQWMAEMRYDDRQMGREMNTDTSVLQYAQSTPAPSATPAASAAP